MTENKSHETRSGHDHDSGGEDSDGVEFISINVHRAHDQNNDNTKVRAQTPKTVQIAESPKLEDSHGGSDYLHRVESPFHEFGKVFFLVFIWVLMVWFLTTTPEKRIEKRQLAIPIAEPKYFNLPHPQGTLVHITLQAPFLPDPKEYPRKASNRSEDTRNKDNTMIIFLRTTSEKILTTNKTFYIYKPHEMDTVNASKIEFTFDIGEDNLDDLHEDEQLQAVLLSNFSKSPDDEKQETPIIFSVDFSPINKPIGVLFAAFTLILLYAVTIFIFFHISLCLYYIHISGATSRS